MVTAFPLQKGYTNLTSGTYQSVFLVHAVEDSTITVSWDANTNENISDTIEMTAGSDFMIDGSKHNTSITITSGKVHIAKT